MGSSESKLPTVNNANTNGVNSNRIGPMNNNTQVPSSSDKERGLYHLVDMHGGGELLKWMQYARKGGDYSLVDGHFETTIKDKMYNGGKGKLESVAELVKRRNKERNERLSAFSRKKGKGKSGPNILDDFNQEANQGDLKKALKLLDGGKGGKGDQRYREIVWKLEERGSMSENLVGCCLMQGSPVHNELAMRLLNEFPKLINDVFLSEDYYGLSPLHQAIVNEDPYLTNYLLQHGADVNQRCYGAFFCPDDQKSSRTDSLEHEYVELSEKTDYTGRMYYGEYPLAFAACTNQFDCYRLLMAKKADPNQRDTNGNTVLHMTVIHENMEMLKLVYDNGGKLQIMNKQNLTPLTLAAKLAKKNMFHQILQLESSTMWNFGQAASVAYPLAKIDTINQETGNLNEDSALSLIVYGETAEHLDLLDGLMEDLLEEKWNSFAKMTWIQSFLGFIFYYIIFFMAFMNRPFSMTTSMISNLTMTEEGELAIDNTTFHGNYSNNNAALFVIPSIFSTPPSASHLSHMGHFSIFQMLSHGDQNIQEYCHLWRYIKFGYSGYLRIICEPLLVLMVMYQLFSEAWEIYHIGKKRWWQVLKSFPSKIFYKVSLLIVVIIIPIRFACIWGRGAVLVDNALSLVCVILTTSHFLYYCRAIKFVGPFILMIYTIITRDMIRFFVIYLIFLIGFSQGFYVIFLACERAENERRPLNVDKEWNNILSQPMESVLRLFIMTIGEFTIFYRTLANCPVKLMSTIGKIIFLIFEIIVSLMLFNLLIAMMTRTYELIYRTQKEWKRQWAQVILMLELSINPKRRLMALLSYSRPIGTDKRKRAFVVTRKIDSNTEIERIRREQQANAIREEKKMILKRRLKDAMNKDGRRSALRPVTSYLLNPTPSKGGDSMMNS